MANSIDDSEEKPDGLEIISIGTLYSGTWDKKYWSSSRGKDRYPYPVGYQARRAYNGSNYKMEIQEGLKGPLFLINSADGQSCSGQTPDIAWGNFQKKGCPRTKIWHGKRFSCKIDGIEFFGFKNPFVQRLLRELVANVHGIAEQGPQVTRKRNKRSATTSNVLNTDGFKKLCGHSTCGPVPTDKQLKSETREVTNDLHLKPVGVPDLLSKGSIPAHQEDKITSPVNNESANVVCDSFVEKISSDRLQDTEVEGLNLSASREFNATDIQFTQDALGIHNVNLCVPDTLEFEEDNSTDPSPSALNIKNCEAKEDAILTILGSSEDLVNKSQPEDETSASNLNENSERSDSDSIGLDITKSMMNVLLPEAIPLLKNNSRKKIKATSPKEFPSVAINQNNESSLLFEPQSSHTDHSVIHYTESTRPATLEKLEGGKSEDHQANLSAIFSSNVEANQCCFGGDERRPDAGKKFSDIYVKDSFDSHADTSMSKDILHEHDDRCPCGVDIYVSEPMLGCTSAGKKALIEMNQNVSQNLNENFLVTENDIKDLKSVPDCNEGRRDATLGTTVTPVLSSITKTLSEDCSSKIKNVSSSQAPKKVYTRKKVLNAKRIAGKCHPPVTEGLLDGHDLETERTLLDTELFHMNSTVDEPLKKEGTVGCSESSLTQPTKFFDIKTSSVKEVEGSTELMKWDIELYNDLDGAAEFLGCYFHPMPILSLVLRRKENEIFICALGGRPTDESRTLFLYKLVTEEPTAGCPFFSGHTLLAWPSSTYTIDKIALERSGLQITPDGQFLVLLGSIRMPYCREGKLNCVCSLCTLEDFDKCAVKIVQVRAGYVSLVSKLVTHDNLQCILVLEPDLLIAAGDNRRLHIWTMGSKWSAPTEKFIIQSNDFICPGLVEMKRIPKFETLVIGHNGFGEFTLWDISKRSFISSFSAPSTSVHQYIPISLFCWGTGIRSSSHTNVEAQVNRLTDATKMYFSEHSKNHVLPPVEMEDIGIWFLVSTTDSQHDLASRDCQKNPAGHWRLALLMKDTLVFGSALDPRAVAAIGTSSGQGIIGTDDGLVYMWELLSGQKLGTLHKFEGGSVSCIGSDEEGTGVVAVADEKGQLLVYQLPVPST